MKNRGSRVRAFFIVVAMLLIASAAGMLAAKRQRIDSRWRDRNVVIDGDNGDWAGPLRPVEENHPVLTEVVNDGQFLYLVLSTSDRTAQRQIRRQGLTVWFDPSGGEKKHFGVKFPVGMPAEAGPARGPGGYRRGPAGGAPRDPDAGESGQAPSPDAVEPINRVEIYGPEKEDVHSFVTEMAPGISVKVGEVQDYLVYELKVPLAKTADAPYAIETKPGALIGFGIETPKMERPSRPGGIGGYGGRGGGGMGGRGGSMGGRGGGGMGSRERVEPPKPIKSWAIIQLASK